MQVKDIIKKSDLNIDNRNIYYNEPMSKYTSFKIGGEAECLIKVFDYNELIEILEIAKKENIKITVFGNGTNSLVLDGGIKGITLMIKFEDIKFEYVDGENIYCVVDAGCKLGKFAQILLKEELTGFEELSGIPGTIGGAIKMNAGAHGKEIKDIVKEVTVINYDGEIKILSKDELQFGYRTSIFEKNKNYIILNAKLLLKRGNKEEIRKKMDEYLKYRIDKQPLEYPNAGSTFKRGKDFITAKLIDDAGLKGYRIGDAEVSIKHSGFIINKGNATAKDVLQLAKYVKDEIYKKFGKEIELEIEILGEDV